MLSTVYDTWQMFPEHLIFEISIAVHLLHKYILEKIFKAEERKVQLIVLYINMNKKDN